MFMLAMASLRYPGGSRPVCSLWASAIFLFVFFVIVVLPVPTEAAIPEWQVSTWVGTSTDDTALPSVFTKPRTIEQQLIAPQSVAVDRNNNLYITDSNRILRVNSLGAITTVAGSTEAGDRALAGENARFSSPHGLVFDTSERYLFVADTDNWKIKRLDTYTGTVATARTLSFAPYDVAIDANNNLYIVGDYQQVVKVNADLIALENMIEGQDENFTGTVRSIAIDRTTTTIYLADDQYVYLILDDGSLVHQDTIYQQPSGLSVDGQGVVYFVESVESRLYRILNDGQGTVELLTPSGSGYRDGLLSTAQFSLPSDSVVAPSGDIFVADTGNQRIRRLYDTFLPTATPNTTSVATITPPPAASFTPTSMVSTTPYVTATPPYDNNVGTFSAEWLSQTTGPAGGNDPISISRGESVSIEARFRNRGTATWFRDTRRSDFVAFYIYKDMIYSTPQEYNDPAHEHFGESFFANSLWGRSFDGQTEFCRAALLREEFVLPGDIGVFTFTFSAPVNASPALHREDLSLAYGPHWMSNPYNGDPLGIAHVWFPIRIE